MTKPVMPPAIAYCVAGELFLSGSELYRTHRAAALLGEQMGWLTFVADRFSPPEKAGDAWYVEIEGQAICPQVIVLKQSVLAMVEVGEDKPRDVDYYQAWDALRQRVEWAQAAGQIFLLDIDDDPYGFRATKEFVSNDEVAILTRYIETFNAVLCSTKALIEEVMLPQAPNQRYEYAPNLYDPWRYDPTKASFGNVLGCHLFLKARDDEDLVGLGAFLRPLFNDFPDLSFHHLGEEYPCRNCGHRIAHHDLSHGTCVDCDNCPVFEEASHDGLARATGLARVEDYPACNPWDLPEHLLWNVGVIPLASDRTWNHAKTEGKGFEMAAAGIPFVALTGDHPLYRRSPGWSPNPSARLQALVTDKDFWHEESEKGRAWAVELAQQHQIEFTATMKRLANSNLTKG